MFIFVNRRSVMCKKLLVLALVAMLSPAVLGSLIVADDFDDGDIGTNTTGIGTGFNAATYQSGWTDPPISAYVTESGTTVSLINEQLGWSRAMITSKEGAALGTDAAGYLFHGVSFSLSNNAWDWGGGGGNHVDRIVLGVQADNIAYNPDDGLKAGFWIQIESDSLVTGTGGWSGISNLHYRDTGGVTTTLATWTFDTLNWDDWADQGSWDLTPVLDLYLNLGPTGYSLTICGDTISNVTGDLSAAYADKGIDISELPMGYAFAYEQMEYPSMTTSIDSIVITGIPEPATIALLGLGGLALLRKKR